MDKGKNEIIAVMEWESERVYNLRVIQKVVQELSDQISTVEEFRFYT